MESDATELRFTEYDRRMTEATARIVALEAERGAQAGRIGILEVQRSDIKEDVEELGRSVRRDMAGIRDELRGMRGDRDSSTLGQKIAYISAAGAVVASMLLAIAQIVGHG